MGSSIGRQTYINEFLFPIDATRKSQSRTSNIITESGLQQTEFRKVRKDKKGQIIWSKSP